MNRYEFYSNLNNFKSLKHASGYKPSGTHEYYAKIDKFYSDGRPRYFYSKEEWDGYSKNKGYEQNAQKDKNTEKFTGNGDPGDPEYNANARRSGLAAEKERKNAGKQTQYGTDAYPVVPKNIRNTENAKDIDDYMKSSEMRSYIAQAIKEAIDKHITRPRAWTSVESKNKDVLAKLKDKDIKKNIVNELRLFGMAGEKGSNDDYIMKVFKEAIDKEYEHQINLLQSQVDTAERKNN